MTGNVLAKQLKKAGFGIVDIYEATELTDASVLLTGGWQVQIMAHSGRCDFALSQWRGERDDAVSVNLGIVSTVADAIKKLSTMNQEVINRLVEQQEKEVKKQQKVAKPPFGQHMVGKYVKLDLGAIKFAVPKKTRKMRIKEAYDYEPSDRSVGIFSGHLYAMLTNDVEIYIDDNGDVFDMNNNEIGKTCDLGVYC